MTLHRFLTRTQTHVIYLYLYIFNLLQEEEIEIIRIASCKREFSWKWNRNYKQEARKANLNIYRKGWNASFFHVIWYSKLRTSPDSDKRRPRGWIRYENLAREWGRRFPMMILTTYFMKVPQTGECQPWNPQYNFSCFCNLFFPNWEPFFAINEIIEHETLSFLISSN